LRNLVLFWWVFLYMWLDISLWQLSIVFPFSVFLIFYVISLGKFVWSSNVSCTKMAISFSRFGKFSAIALLNMFSIPLAYSFAPSSMPMIWRFVLLMVSLTSCKLCQYFFNFIWMF
jgi:hypothetical protein